MKKILSIIMMLSPFLFFPQRKVEDFFNNRIDFVLDNDHGRAFMGGIVKEYIIDDSLSANNTYNKIGIQPFYKYSQSTFFDKNLLKENDTIFTNKKRTEFEIQRKVGLKTDIHFRLNLNSLGGFNIKTTGGYGRSRFSFYETFKNFELSFYTSNWYEKSSLAKSLYSNVNILVKGISLFEENSISNIIFYNTLYAKFNNSKKDITFSIKIYETIGMGGSYVEVDKNHIEHHYLGNYPDITMRKVEITGNEKEAIKYLKKNKLDYIEIEPQKYDEENFKERKY